MFPSLCLLSYSLPPLLGLCGPALSACRYRSLSRDYHCRLSCGQNCYTTEESIRKYAGEGSLTNRGRRGRDRCMGLISVASCSVSVPPWIKESCLRIFLLWSVFLYCCRWLKEIRTRIWDRSGNLILQYGQAGSAFYHTVITDAPSAWEWSCMVATGMVSCYREMCATLYAVLTLPSGWRLKMLLRGLNQSVVPGSNLSQGFPPRWMTVNMPRPLHS